MALKAFTIWFAGRPGYRSQISYADERIAKTGRTRPAPSVDDIRIVGDMYITGRCWSGATGRWLLASGRGRHCSTSALRISVPLDLIIHLLRFLCSP
jgi:hypothetical protein